MVSSICGILTFTNDPKAGFPFFQLDRFLKILIQELNQTVALSEEYAIDAASKVKSGGLLFDRRVSRIVTPGTLIDETFMDPYESNHLLALNVSGPSNSRASSMERQSLPSDPDHQSIGLAWMDLSTGAFYTQSCAVSSLSSAVTSINPREIVIDEGLDPDTFKEVVSRLNSRQPLITRYQPRKGLNSPDSWSTMLEHPVPPDTAASFTEEENLAASILLDYGVSHLQDLPLRLQSPVKRITVEVMALDGSTIRALEIKETLRERLTKGSLLQTIRRTVTKSGARLLSSYLSE